MENKFEKPVMEVITFEAEDIITTSGGRPGCPTDMCPSYVVIENCPTDGMES